ncbi:hypothetical protein Q9R29_15365 [Rothia sp. ARF10]|nr:hypothetical protein [Rothia sp. ARF10]
MALAWVVLAVFATRLLWLVRECLLPDTPLSRTQAVMGAIVLAGMTGGTVLTFDAALPWVYHEVYLWATSLAVTSAYWLLRVALDPSRTSIFWLGAAILGTVLTRTPGGLAMSGTAVLLGAWIVLRDRRAGGPARLSHGTGTVAAGLLPAVVSVAYNWTKFGHPYLFPLESQVWTQVNAHRREALQANGGTITGFQFLETTLTSYFRPDGIRFVDYFPFITLPAEPPRAVGGAFIDQAYRTGSVPSFMPMLVLLCLAALPALMSRGVPERASALRWPALGAVLVGGAVLGYGYLAHRYTSDFVPALIVMGAIGVWWLAGWLRGARAWRAAVAIAAMAGLCAFSLAAQAATGTHVAALTHRGDELTSYLSLQERLSGGPDSPVARLVSRSDSLPEGGSADDLHVVGDCAALYVNTGDQYEPWTLVEQRDMTVVVTPTFLDYHPGLLRVFEQDGVERRHVSLEFDAAAPQARLVVEDDDGNFVAPWFEVARGRQVSITAHAIPELSQIRLRVDDDPRSDLYVPTAEWNEDWYSDLTSLRFLRTHDGGSQAHARVSNRWGPVPGLCGRLTSNSVLTR